MEATLRPQLVPGGIRHWSAGTVPTITIGKKWEHTQNGQTVVFHQTQSCLRTPFHWFPLTHQSLSRNPDPYSFLHDAPDAECVHCGLHFDVLYVSAEMRRAQRELVDYPGHWFRLMRWLRRL